MLVVPDAGKRRIAHFVVPGRLCCPASMSDALRPCRCTYLNPIYGAGCLLPGFSAYGTGPEITYPRCIAAPAPHPEPCCTPAGAHTLSELYRFGYACRVASQTGIAAIGSRIPVSYGTISSRGVRSVAPGFARRMLWAFLVAPYPEGDGPDLCPRVRIACHRFLGVLFRALFLDGQPLFLCGNFFPLLRFWIAACRSRPFFPSVSDLPVSVPFSYSDVGCQPLLLRASSFLLLRFWIAVCRSRPSFPFCIRIAGSGSMLPFPDLSPGLLGVGCSLRYRPGFRRRRQLARPVHMALFPSHRDFHARGQASAPKPCSM